QSSTRFLASWIIVYLVFFSLSGTKLPNYILPIYPAAAIWTARFLDEWRRGLISVPNWTIHAGLVSVGLIGIVASMGLVVIGGTFDFPLLRGRKMPGLEVWALVGLIPLAGAIIAAWLVRTGRKTGMVAILTTTGLLFVGILAAWATVPVDALKAPRALI